MLYNIKRYIQAVDKRLFLLFISSLFLIPVNSYALSDSFQQIPDTHVPCATLATIGDTPSGTCADPVNDVTGRASWDISPFEASSTWHLSIINSGTSTMPITIGNRYLYMWYRTNDFTSPTCSPFIADADGNIYGTSTPTPNAGTGIWGTSATDYNGYTQSHLGFTYNMSLCRYDLGSGGTHNGLVFYNSTSTDNGILDSAPFQPSIVAFGGKIYAIYSTASSTEGTDLPDISAFYNYLDSINNNTSNTHIISFTPSDGDILSASSSVDFTLNAYIHPSDFGSFTNVRITLHNIDQNTLLSSLSADDIVLYQALATSSGYFAFATSTPLDVGNYRIEASLTRTYLYGIIQNPFSDVSSTQSHQFIVGTSTFLGHISQKSFSETQSIYSAFTATSTEALAGTCNPISGFSVMSCLAFLFIPSSEQINDSMNSLRQGVTTKVPLGYVTRVYNILQGTATSSLPAYTVDVPYNVSADTIHFSLDMNAAFASATEELTDTRDPIHNNNLRDIMEPFVQMLVAFAVLYEILTDLMGSHKHANIKQ